MGMGCLDLTTPCMFTSAHPAGGVGGGRKLSPALVKTEALTEAHGSRTPAETLVCPFVFGTISLSQLRFCVGRAWESTMK